MATTSIIVELLIIGFFCIIWILLFSVRLSLIDIESLKQLTSTLQSTPALLIITALSYQLGVVMNGLSHKLTKRFGQARYRNEISKYAPYEAIKMKVRQEGSEEMSRTIALHLSVVRLTRAGIINFSLIAMAMFSFGGKMALAAIIPLFIFLLSIIGWRGAYRGYYRRMAYAYHQISGLPIDDDLFSE
jgi:hypothetical protein